MLIARHAAKLLQIPRNLWGEGHLIISIRVRRLVESESHWSQLRSYSTTTTTCYNMAASINDIVQKLKSLSIEPTATIAHSETSSTATWKEALIASRSAPKSFEIIKTLVYKPKTAKTATPVPVVVIARDETDTNSTAIGKKLNLKELRLASEDLLRDFFSLDKNSCTLLLFFSTTIWLLIYKLVSPLSLSENTFSKVVTVLDDSIASSSSLFAIHANSSNETYFLTGKSIESYLKSLETADVKVQEIDLKSLATAPVAVAQTSKAPVKEKEDAKIEGAVQIAIGVKKEVDFATWYTNVNCCLLDLFITACLNFYF